MDDFLKTLPWEAQGFIYVLSALVVALAFLAVPVSVLERIGTVTFNWRGRKIYPFCANGISAIRVPVTLGGAYMFYSGYAHYWGCLATMAGFILDRMDGKMAAVLQAYKERVGDPSIPGRTPYGKVVDPAADKLCILPMLWHELCAGFLGGALSMVLMTVFEVIGTVVRPPFINRKWRNRWYRWSVVSLRRRLRDPKASGFGKMKMALQVATLALSMPYRLQWWDGDRAWLGYLLWAVAVFAGLSVLSRFRLHRYLDGVVTPLDEFFSHGLSNGKNGAPKSAGGNGKV